jgi:hypothetical protein
MADGFFAPYFGRWASFATSRKQTLRADTRDGSFAPFPDISERFKAALA